jgi:tripartite-type tricarboxylate transporter receptor subunit TctC
MRHYQSAASVTAAMILGIGLSPQYAAAQSYPTKPVRLIVAVAPGGNLDLVGRATAQSLSETLGQQVIVENRPGANSTIGAGSVARSAADGYTLLMVAPSLLVAPQMMRNAPFDPTRDFAGISKIALLPQMLVVHPSVPVKSVRDLITLAKARPGELNFATSGNGSGSHMAAEMFMRQAGIRMMRIPYNGDGPALVDLVGGQVPIKFDNLSTSIPHVRTGRLRPLGVTSSNPSALLPGVPSISETLPGFEASIFNGMVAPAKSPSEILTRLHAGIVKFTQTPQHVSRFAALGVELQSSPSAEHFTTFLRNEYARFAKVLRDAGIQPN